MQFDRHAEMPGIRQRRSNELTTAVGVIRVGVVVLCADFAVIAAVVILAFQADSCCGVTHVAATVTVTLCGN